MKSFSEAFKRGIKAVAESKSARQEISGVFIRLNEELSQVSEGRLRISIQTATSPGIPNKDSIFSDATHRKKRDEALAASNPTHADLPFVELAMWNQDEDGFPCVINWDGDDVFCEDLPDLENVLCIMLQTRKVAEKLLDVMNDEESNDSSS